MELIDQRITPLRAQLANHPLYTSIGTLAHLRLFMESHVFAVWDFMSLLKSLQLSLTSVASPWVPTEHPSSRRFVNEIVLAEESDLHQGRHMSHFEIYVEAMLQADADVAPIQCVVAAAKSGQFAAVDEALKSAPMAAQRFARSTFQLIRDGSLPARAAAFTFGREDAIPDMFRALVMELNHEISGDLSQFVWYLQRHIEIDGDDHGPLSRRMVNEVCGANHDAWEQAANAAEDAMRARLALWDGILAQIHQK